MTKGSKVSTVEHWMLNGRSGTQVASELGVNVQNLCDWKQKFKALPAGQVANTLDELQAENRRLQKELHRVAQQRDIPSKNPTYIAAARSTIVSDTRSTY